MKKSTLLAIFVLAIMVGYTVSAMAIGQGSSIQGNASIPKGRLQVKAITQIAPYATVALDPDDTLSTGQLCANPCAANSDPKLLGYNGSSTIEVGQVGTIYTTGLLEVNADGGVVAGNEIGSSSTSGHIVAGQTGGGICLETATDEVVFVLKLK